MCYLHEAKEVPLAAVSKRFKISPYKARKIIQHTMHPD
jgi:hypothetical protein